MPTPKDITPPPTTPSGSIEKVLETESCIYFRGNLKPELAGEISRVEKKTVVLIGDCEVIDSEIIKAALEERVSAAYTQGRSSMKAEILAVMPEETKRPFTLNRSEENYNEGFENGHNSCRSKLLAKIGGIV